MDKELNLSSTLHSLPYIGFGEGLSALDSWSEIEDNDRSQNDMFMFENITKVNIKEKEGLYIICIFNVFILIVRSMTSKYLYAP